MENNQILDMKELKLVEKIQTKEKLDEIEEKILIAYTKCVESQKTDGFKSQIHRIGLSTLESFRTLMLQNNFFKAYLRDCLNYMELTSKRKQNFDTLLMDEIEKVRYELFDIYTNPHVSQDQLTSIKDGLYRTLAGNEILIDTNQFVHQRYFILDGPYHYLDKNVYQEYCNLLFTLFRNPFTGEIIINPADMVTLFQNINELIMEKQKGEYSGARHLELAAQFQVLQEKFPTTLKPVFFDKMQYNGNICIPKETISSEHLLNLTLVIQQDQYYLTYLVQRKHNARPQVEAFNIFNNKSLGLKSKYKVVDSSILKQYLMDMDMVKDQYTVAEIQQILEQLNQKKTEKRVKVKQ